MSIPPTIKYQSDGGPGIHNILDLLKGSDDPEGDQKIFLKAQVCFWLLGATDGHAKNFSIFLTPGGRFQLTPLYDVMSAQPNVDAKQLQQKRFKLAMAVGTNRHYVMHTILPRHFIQMAKRARVSEETVTAIFQELDRDVPRALEKTQAQLPRGFPEKLADSISGGVKARLKEWQSSFKQSRGNPSRTKPASVSPEKVAKSNGRMPQ